MKGFDFGTSTSFVAESNALRTAIVPLGATHKWVPSIGGFEGNDWFVCDEASLLPEDQIVRSAKRAITQNKVFLPVSDGKELLETNADEVIIAVIEKIIHIAGDSFVDLTNEGDVRLGCPAMWDGQQRQRLINLANRAGLPVGDNTVIDEPIAAGVAWIARQIAQGEFLDGKVLVFDMGGGTLDVAVLDVHAEPGKEFQISVQAAHGVAEAGDSLDGCLEDVLVRRFEELGHPVVGLPDEIEYRGWIRRAAREAKLELSTLDITTVLIGHPTVKFPELELTRDDLNGAFEPQLAEAMKVVWHSLRAALMAEYVKSRSRRAQRPSVVRTIPEWELANNVQYILLAGGMSQIPAIHELFRVKFPGVQVWLGDEAVTSKASASSDELIARGLAHDEVYERMNLHRPGFNFILEWTDTDTGVDRTEEIYGAYSPLYTPEKASYFDSVKYTWRPKPGVLPSRGVGTIRIRTMGGQEIGLKRGMDESLGIPYHFGPGSTPVVSLEPNGRIFVRDSKGYEGEMRVSQWPVIRASKQMRERAEFAWLIIEPHHEDSAVNELEWQRESLD